MDSFSSWLYHTRRAQMTDGGTLVPCGECRGCCTSSYFIHIRPDETRTIASIPEELLFAAPGLPKGYMLLGYDENGHCPMFQDNSCAIYPHRPIACRNYDCRVFTATGLSPGDDRAVIAQQAHRWEFAFPTPEDHSLFSAVRTAAGFLKEHAECFPTGFIPSNTAQQAVLAIEVYEVFLDHTREQGASCPGRNRDIAKAVMAVCATRD